MQSTFYPIVKPDCTISTTATNKSLGVKKALTSLLKICLTELTTNPSTSEEILPSINDLRMFDFKCVPNHISSNTKVAIVEFAAAKFKTFATTGERYIKYVTGSIINKLLRDLQNLQRIIICEEKYSFTPDVFKAATRQKRQTKDPVTIVHLKEKDEIISRDKFSKKAAITTALGMKAVSTYLGKHLTELDIQADIIIDVDSEAVYGQYEFEDSDKCTCPLFTTPVRTVFTQGKWIATF